VSRNTIDVNMGMIFLSGSSVVVIIFSSSASILLIEIGTEIQIIKKIIKKANKQNRSGYNLIKPFT